ncbi:MAG: glycosyltransferase family 39 protein, partial [Terriglobales bacterium]
MAVAWLLALIASSFALAWETSRDRRLAERLSVARLLTLIKERTPAVVGNWYALAIAGLIVVLGLIAFFCPPNNYDALSYHLSRVEHWICNGSVKHFSTGVLRQVAMGPGAEFIIASLRLLSGGDRLSNCVQWFSMLGSVIAASLLAKQLGANSKGQLLASVVCVSLPLGILESTSSQNDYVITFWFVCLVSHCLSLIMRRSASRVSDSVWIGLSLGLAALTKATACFYALPFLVWLALARFFRNKAQTCGLMALSLTIALLLTLPFLSRNAVEFGSPIVAHGNFCPGYRLPNESITPAYTLSNVLRNVAIELESPVDICNRIIFRSVTAVH